MQDQKRGSIKTQISGGAISASPNGDRREKTAKKTGRRKKKAYATYSAKGLKNIITSYAHSGGKEKVIRGEVRRRHGLRKSTACCRLHRIG